jgi:hypothetical protein
MIIEGRRPIAGISNNNAADLKDWAFSWYTPAGVLISATGQLVPLSGSIQHGADVRVIRDNRGNEVTVLFSNEKAIIEIVAVPLGAPAANTLAAALTAAQFPAPGGWLTIADAPVLVMGTFTDAFNADNWMYNADGRVELVSEGEWGMRFSCTRRVNMAKTAGVIV